MKTKFVFIGTVVVTLSKFVFIGTVVVTSSKFVFIGTVIVTSSNPLLKECYVQFTTKQKTKKIKLLKKNVKKLNNN